MKRKLLGTGTAVQDFVFNGRSVCKYARPYYPFPRIRTNSSHVLRTSWHPHSGIRGKNGQDTPQIMTEKIAGGFFGRSKGLNASS